jgi:hypothetical protein
MLTFLSCPCCTCPQMSLLEALQILAKREAVRRHVQRKTSQYYGEQLAEINTIKKQFDHLRRTPPSHPVLPRFAGTARCAAINPAAALPTCHCGASALSCHHVFQLLR